MNRKINIFLVIVLIASHLIGPFQLLSVKAEEHLFDVKMDTVTDEKLDVIDVSFNPNKEWDKTVIELDSETQFISSSVDGQENVEDLSYNEKEHEVTIESKEPIKNLKLFLKTLSHEVQLIKLTGYLENEIIASTHYQYKTQVEETEDFSSIPPVEVTETAKEQVLEEPLIETAPELQRDLRITAINPKVESGTDALFKLIFKTTGSQVKYQNARVVVDLPLSKHITFTQDLKELAIENVVPNFNKDTNQLEYHFDMLPSGITYEKIIKVSTENGYLENNKELEVKSNLILQTAKGEKNQVDRAKSKINASNSVTMSKKVSKTERGGKASIPTLNSWIEWEVKVNIPYKETGQMYLKPGSKIIIEDTLPSGISFERMNTNYNYQPKISKNKLTWEFVAPSIEEQLNSKNGLFDITLKFWTKVNDNKTLINKTLINKSNVNLTFIDDKYLTPAAKAEANITIVDSVGSTGEDKGSVVYSSHYGPADGNGTPGDNDTKNPNPSVDDAAILQFRHNIWGFYYAKEHDLKSFKVTYTIDDNLILETFRAPGDVWKFARTNAEYKEDIPLPVEPQYDIVIHYIENGKNGKITLRTHEKGKTYTRNELGLKPNQRVTKIEYDFKGQIPQGLTNNSSARYYFSVKQGYTGEVKNKLDMTGESTFNPKLSSTNKNNYKSGSYHKFDYRKDFPEYYEGSKDAAGDRTAKITKVKNNKAPISEISVSLLTHQNNKVDSGSNRMKLTLKNNNASTGLIQGPVETVVLLPPGVTLKDKPNASYTGYKNNSTNGNYQILNNDYNNSGRQLVKVTWDDGYIRKGDQVTAELDVNVSKNAPQMLYFDIYGFTKNESMKVPNSTNASITDTILQKDMDEDLNNDNKKDQLRLKSGNLYYLVGEYDLQTEKFVKSLDGDWDKMARTLPGERIDYKLQLTNTTGKDISALTLIDVLPSIGDIGLTDNIARGSQFTPSLNGPIKIPKEWEGKVAVYYSTAKNPKRDDLVRETIYPSGTIPLSNPSNATNPNWQTEKTITDWKTIHSFKIELLPGKEWIKGQGLEILFDMTAPKVSEVNNDQLFNTDEDIASRAAYNSFAVATDTGQPVEPYQVGVYMDAGRLELLKVDADNEQIKLAGAQFELRNENGDLIETLETDSNGHVISKPLDLGNYTLHEIKAPKGYSLLTKPISFEITKDYLNIELSIENNKHGWYLPNTGGIGTTVFYALGIMVMLGSLTLYIRAKRSDLN